jgi:hypothetical protein
VSNLRLRVIDIDTLLMAVVESWMERGSAKVGFLGVLLVILGVLGCFLMIFGGGLVFLMVF